MNQKDIETLAIALPEDILKAKWCGDFDRAFQPDRPIPCKRESPGI